MQPGSGRAPAAWHPEGTFKCGLFTIAISAARFGQAAAFGNLVASITIMKPGTGTASPDEILRAEELASSLPAKLMLPLILFIFPCLMGVLILPAAIHISQAFKH